MISCYQYLYPNDNDDVDMSNNNSVDSNNNNNKKLLDMFHSSKPLYMNDVLYVISHRCQQLLAITNDHYTWMIKTPIV